MRTYRTALLLSVIVTGYLPGNVTAQETRNLTLTEAIELSIAHSGQIKLDNARVDEAIASYHEARNNRLPDVKASGAYMRLNNPNVDLKVKLGGSGTDTTKKSSSGAAKVDQAAYGIVNASLPIFSGLRIRHSIEAAKYLEQATRLDALHDRDEVVLNTINAYCALFKSRRSVELVKENLKQQQQRVTDFTNLEKNGLLARNDLLKAQLQQSNTELSLLDAENDYKLTCMTVSLMLGFPEGTEFVPDSAGLADNPDAGTVVVWEQLALQNRGDLASIGMREKAGNASISSIKGEYYPGIALTGGYIAATIPNFLTITNAVNIGIGLQYNFGALWKTGAKLDQANARQHQLQATQGILSDAIKLQTNQAYRNYLLNLQKIGVYQKAVEQANENYRVTKSKFDNHLATTTELLEADVAQFQAQISYTFSKADAMVAYKKLQQTAGILADAYKPLK